MSVETFVGLPNQFTVKTFFARTRFIARYKQDRLTLRIEGEGRSPFAIRRANARISVCTSSRSTSNSGSNSSPISTTQITTVIWHRIHMMSNSYLTNTG